MSADEHVVMHHWGAGTAVSPCGRSVASVYDGVPGHGYTSSWKDVDCTDCLVHKPAPHPVVRGDQYGNTVDREIIVPICRNSDTEKGQRS